MEKLELTREDLMQLCRDAVVHHTDWQNRDSYCAQRSIQSIYEGLSAGLDYEIMYNSEYTMTISFLTPIDLDKFKRCEYLDISSLDEYFEDCDPEHETEMFNGWGIDFVNSEYPFSYMPTRKRLDEANGGDWF